ncbi:hypothetical protein [Alicyclobacillus fastidiosus]|uniref:Cthe-2314-like HEPN domain-containing protein n=1 Tax=Alicyclobacillus fastidiosus TaxID=392011 RepID=A0ABV5AIB8_9BACL|nr:hypothetical protein [Alicyclobacillus fastidiosus]WEH11115.1 hypothetical protein PYS47_07825 [Alicyclobacillus fastidiosus]
MQMTVIRDRMPFELPDWNKYMPAGTHYVKYPANVVAACFKIGDVYYSFCNARAALIFYDSDDYGELVHDENGKLVFRAQQLYQALFHFNACIDFSWQATWLYVQEESLDLLYDDLLEKAAKEFDLEKLLCQLTLAREFKLRDHITNYFNSVQVFREKYNYLKHRGTFYIPGIGSNDGTTGFKYNEIDLHAFRRRELNFKSWEHELMDFYFQFIEYFEALIHFVVPSMYLDNSIGVEQLLHYGKRVKLYLNDKD